MGSPIFRQTRSFFVRLKVVSHICLVGMWVFICAGEMTHKCRHCSGPGVSASGQGPGINSPLVLMVSHQNGPRWVWVNTYRYIFSGMTIHLPAILGFTRYQGFDPSPDLVLLFGGLQSRPILACAPKGICPFQHGSFQVQTEMAMHNMDQ